MRAYKTVNDSYIEPISFTVPRRAETFQADIFPPAVGTKPIADAKGWFDGKTGIPAKIDLESIYDGGAPKEVPSDYKPPPTQPPPAARPEPKKEEAARETPKPAAVATRGPPPSMQEQKGSMAAMASKFQDDEGVAAEDDGERSSFEEVSRPAQRTAAPARSEPRAAASPPRSQPAPVSAPAKSSSPDKTPTPTPAPAAAFSQPPSNGVESSLDQIKLMIENQTKIISAQNDRIGHLAAEVESIKKRVSSTSQDQSERIRQLELELEEARS